MLDILVEAREKRRRKGEPRTKLSVGDQLFLALQYWREFELPFNLMNLKPESVTLEINVVMPGKGTIKLSGLTVSDLRTGGWLDSRMGGLFGGLLGTIWGIYGGVVGGLCGFLVPRGKGRRWLIGMIVFVMGVRQLLIGISALLLGQPYHVWHPLMLVGGILVAAILPSFFVIKRAYKQVELRKLQALDA